MMFAHKLRVVPVAVALVAAVLAGGWLLAAPPENPPPGNAVAADPPAAPQPAPKAADPRPQPKGPNKILFYRTGHLTLIDPDGTNEKKVSQDRAKFHPGDARISPDGKKLAFLVQAEEDPPAGRDPRRKLYVRGLEDKEPGTDVGVECQMFSWSPDGTQIAYSDFVDGDKKPESVHGVVNVKTKEKTALKLPEGHMITDWSRDGKYFLTTSIDGVVTREKFPTAKLHLLNRDGTEFKALTDGKTPALFGRISPDGKRVLYLEMNAPKVNPRPGHTLHVLDVADGKATKLEDVPLNAELMGYCWSPDGKRIAYVWREIHDGKPEEVRNRETESFLVVCDRDGKNQKAIATEKGDVPALITISGVDWR
jgi:Tol biopolymer transport system component